MNKLIYVVVVVILLASCSPEKIGTCLETQQVEGMTVQTFYNNEGNITALIITEGNSVLAGKPISTLTKRKMGDEEFKCLKACKKLDGSFDMNCVLKCPVTKQLSIGTFQAVAN